MDNDKRIYDVYTASSTLFIQKGYSQTQISDIAKASSISTGSIYTLFASKKAIFQFVLKCVFEEDYLQSEITLPIREMDTDELKELLIKSFDLNLSALFQQDKNEAKNSKPFQEVLSLAFDVVSKFGTGFLIFERNSTSWPELSGAYYKARSEFIENFEKCMESYMVKGEIRQLEHPKYHARLIIETLSWWGMHVKYDISDIQINNTDAKLITIDALAHAYIRSE